MVYKTNNSIDLVNAFEPQSMHGQPPVIWHSANGSIVTDEDGKKYIDFTSGVLVANSGHNHPRINKAIKDILDQGLLTSYIFVNRPRAKLLEKLAHISPYDNAKSLLFCSGSEAVEASLKLSLEYSRQRHAQPRTLVLSFRDAFHGRTLGAQLVGGIPTLKSWIADKNPHFLQIELPSQSLTVIEAKQYILEQMSINCVNEMNVASIILETYQGGTVLFPQYSFVRALRDWTKNNEIVFILDEIQSGFGRTGKMWGFEHYDIVPDLIVCGKGISSSLPVSAVIGPEEFTDIFSPGAMSTTHSGNPLCCAAALENISVILDEELVENSREMGILLHDVLEGFMEKYSTLIQNVSGRGLVAGVSFFDAECAKSVVLSCVDNGVLLFNPVGPLGTTLKINPPLSIDKDLLLSGLKILDTSLSRIVHFDFSKGTI